MRIDLTSKKTLAAMAIALLLLLSPVIRYLVFVTVPAGSGRNVQIFDFEKGYTPKRIAEELERAKIISSARLFVVYARLKGEAGRLKAGEYQFNDGMKPGEILQKMVAGEIYARKFAVPEGYSIYQVAELLEGRGLFKKDAFLAQSADQKLLTELGIDGKTVEGHLYPSTYNVTQKMDEAALIRAMTTQFDKVYRERLAPQAGQRGMSKKEVVILASIIEKEAIVPAERPLISSVFHNRLRKGMRLQSDPTAVYGVRAFSGNVTKKDIMRHSLYNTYLIDALPPGPIGNPGVEAMEAAINPARTDYLYFVAKKDGTHHFSRTLAEHNAAVRTYLKP